MFPYYGLNHVYTAHELQRMMVSPVGLAAHYGKEFFASSTNPLSYTIAGRSAAAACELVERVTRHYGRPEFGIKETTVGKQKVAIKTRVAGAMRPFGRLLHFQKMDIEDKRKKADIKEQPKLLLVAPMSGHYSTLLRGTVEDMLPHADVYITEWRNAQEVPLSEGRFDLDSYIDYLINWFEMFEGDIHVMAVCQPAVPVLAAVSIMAAEKNLSKPKSMTLMGGPIDTRKNPTQVNKVAEERPISWFEQNVVSHVPFNYPGFMRAVYPGFIQLTGFMTMNMDRHISAHADLFNHLVEGDGESADSHRDFYNEYLSVMDIPAEFYLQTVKLVFQEHALPKGTMVSNGREVKPEAISKTALLCIEGERDDISGRGQTKAAMTICKNLPENKKKYHLQKGVGHYGVFNGRRFRQEIVPVIVDFISRN